MSLLHGHLPFQCILEALALPSATFLDVSFNFDTNDSDEPTRKLNKLATAKLEQAIPMLAEKNLYDDSKVVSKFDLSLTINHDHHTNSFMCTLEGSRTVFNLTTIQALADRFRILCTQLFCSPFDRQNQPIYELSIILPNEQEMIQQLNNYTITSNVTCCIHQAFIQQAIMHPDKLAVILDNQSLTYDQLLSQVQQLALHLINEKGVKPGDIVCQCVDRSIEMIVGIMGIMMSGGVYAPLSPSDPIVRLESLVRQVGAKLVLVNQMSSTHVRLLGVPIVDISEIINCTASLSGDEIDQLYRVPVTPESISYIVFTSGSTGTPKAVQLRHRNFMAYMQTHLMRHNDIVLQMTSASFDGHIEEICGTLVVGAQLAILRVGRHLDFEYATKTIHEKNVTYVTLVPSWMNALGQFLSENPYAQERVKQVRCWDAGGKEEKHYLLITIHVLFSKVNYSSVLQFFNYYHSSANKPASPIFMDLPKPQCQPLAMKFVAKIFPPCLHYPSVIQPLAIAFTFLTTIDSR
jgi:non-ribosomal peptide synthetase component F